MSKYAFRIEPGQHAKLSASSAERWLTCPGSVALSAGLPNVSSAYAAQGTAAHYIGAHCLNNRDDHPGKFIGKVALVEGHEIALDEELISAVEEYVDYVISEERIGDEGAVEQSFTPAMRKLHPDFGGSTDYVLWRASERLLRIVDYKHGAGVPVEVDENKQLKYYALGALISNPQWNAEFVEIVIVQPRCEHEKGRIRSFAFGAFELLDFAGDLIEGAKRTEEFGADLIPSKKACKWCPAAAANKCPAIEKQTHALVEATFSQMALEQYSREQIAEFLTKAPLVEQHISAVREFAYQQALHHGVDFPGWKIVDKRPTRKWTDESLALAEFRDVPGVMKAPELRSPAQIEKLVGKKKFAERASTLVEKKSSGHTLAPTEDNRLAVTPLLKVLELFEPEAPEQS